MWKSKHHLLHFFAIFLQINAILSAKLPQRGNEDDVVVIRNKGGNAQMSGEQHTHSGRNVLPKRQTGSFGFQHNSLPTTGNYYPISGGSGGGGRYEPIRGNGLILNSNNIRGDRDRDYYPSAYPTSSRSSGRSGGGGGLGYNGYRDDYGRDRLDSSRDRFGDYRGDRDRLGDYRGDRDRQPYYDDYRYNGYQSARDREAAAAQNMEYTMRNGQQRHSEYQKRIGQSGQEYYDPFYFIGLRNKQNGMDGGGPLGGGSSGLVSGGGGGLTSFPPPPSMSSPSLSSSSMSSGSSSSSSSGSGNGLLSPSSTTSTGQNSQNPPSSPSAPASHPLRNRRNSQRQRHQQRHANDFYDNEISGDKYELMSSKKNIPYIENLLEQRNNNGGRDHPPTSHHHRHNNERWANNNNPHHPLDQQFLTREQLIRQHPDSRVHYPGHNRIDRDRNYGSTINSASGQPWSVRIGTQLKVNDDGRSPNPHRFYVRDEMDLDRNRSRYPGPIYRRK